MFVSLIVENDHASSGMMFAQNFIKYRRFVQNLLAGGQAQANMMLLKDTLAYIKNTKEKYGFSGGFNRLPGNKRRSHRPKQYFRPGPSTLSYDPTFRKQSVQNKLTSKKISEHHIMSL
jgi:hypothetical protein